MFEAIRKRKEERDRQRKEEKERQHKEEMDRQREEEKERQRIAAKWEAVNKRREEIDRQRREEMAHRNDPTVVIKRAVNTTLGLAGGLAGLAWKNMTVDNGKAVFNKAVETAVALPSGIKDTAVALPSGVKAVYNHVDRSLKQRETFACYYTNSDGRTYPGTLYFTDICIAFSTEHSLPTYIKTKKRDLPLLPPGQESWNIFYDYEKKSYAAENEVFLAWRHVTTIKKQNSESPSERSIEINRSISHSYNFMGFVDYEKAFYTLNLLRPSV